MDSFEVGNEFASFAAVKESLTILRKSTSTQFYVKDSGNVAAALKRTSGKELKHSYLVRERSLSQNQMGAEQIKDEISQQRPTTNLARNVEDTIIACAQAEKYVRAQRACWTNGQKATRSGTITTALIKIRNFGDSLRMYTVI